MIGLFLGEKKLPIKILNSLKKKKIKYFIIDLTKNFKFKKFKNSYSINIGKFGKILSLIKEKKCKKVLFAGLIDKPKINNLKFDIKGIFYLPRIIKASKLGDAAILKELIKILNENKVKVIKLNFFNPELTLKRGNYTTRIPTINENGDIIKGMNYLNKLSSYNHVQALVVRNGKVISKETSKGTKKMLLSIKKSKKHRGILIKLPKKKQDLRVDLPTIGIDTLKDCKRSGISGIVLKSKKNIFLDQTKSIEFANLNKMFISVR